MQAAPAPLGDGHRMGGQPDGMLCLPGAEGHWVLLRNHELGGPIQLAAVGATRWVDPVPTDVAFSTTSFGGVSRVVVDPKRLGQAFEGNAAPGDALVTSNAVLVGTDRNCAGGSLRFADGRHAWVSCEESDAEGHGWAFMAFPDDAGLVPAAPRCLRSWGRFVREGIAQDTRRGAIYMSEDLADGLVYRFTPHDKTKPDGEGVLEALAIDGVGHTDPHLLDGPQAQGFPSGMRWATHWVPIEDPAATSVPCREQGTKAGATAFNRVEGIVYDAERDRVNLIASTAGPLQAGQIFTYAPGEAQLTLLTQVEDRSVLSMPDNATLAPWGDLILAEDNYDRRGAHSQFVRGLRPDGSVYDILRNRANDPGGGPETPPGAEFAGCCFSPDGRVLFVNVQGPLNATLAVTGDWSTLALPRG